MRLYSWLLLYTHCLLTFCVVALYWNTWPSRRPVAKRHEFAVLMNAPASGTPAPLSPLETRKQQVLHWGGALVGALRRHHHKVPPLASDELSAAVEHTNVFGPPSTTWVDHLRQRPPGAAGSGGPAAPRVLVVTFLAPGAETHTFWQAVLAMQACAHDFEMFVLVVVVGDMQEQSATRFRQWTRDLAQQAHAVRQSTAQHGGLGNRVRAVTVMWMQGALRGVLRESLLAAQRSGAVDAVLWIHSAAHDFVRMCGLVSQFAPVAAPGSSAVVSARCFDESQLRNFEKWRGAQRELRDEAAGGEAGAGGGGAGEAGAAGYASQYHRCNVLFPLHLWEPRMRTHSTLDTHGTLRWNVHGMHGEHALAPDTVFVMSIHVFY